MHFLQSLDLDTAMFEALVQDRADFVQLFVDSGVNFKKFLTVRRLRDLYDKVKWNYFFAYVKNYSCLSGGSVAAEFFSNSRL